MADNLKILKNLFATLQDPLFLGDGATTGEFHTLLQPGQFISTNIQQADSTDDMYTQAALVNGGIDTTFVYKPLLSTVDRQYSDILTQKALPYSPISAPDQREIANLRNWIANAEPTYDVYRGRYFDALDAYSQEAHSQAPNPARLQRLAQYLNDANDQWNTVGQRPTYDRNVGRMIYLQSADPAAIWNDLSNQFSPHRKQAPTLGPYMETFLTPPVSSWMSSASPWASFQKTINETDTYNYSSYTEWGGSGGAGWGLFSIGGGASGGSSYSHQESDATAITVAFEYMRVRIVRPWLVPDVLGYRFWWWLKTFGYRLLSDGGNLQATPPVRPKGTLPFLPMYLIVARNLQITANFSHQDATSISQHMSASASFGWGPFSCSGSYSEGSTLKTTKGTFDGTTIRVDQPQIIAFTGPLVPRTPNPDRTLPWQGDQAPFDPPAPIIEQLRKLERKESDQAAIMSKLDAVLIEAEREKERTMRSARRSLEVEMERNAGRQGVSHDGVVSNKSRPRASVPKKSPK